MFEKFTDRTRKIVALANQHAHRNGTRIIGDAEVLLGLLEEGSGVGAKILEQLGLDTKRTYNELVGKPSSFASLPMSLFPQTAEFKKMIETAIAASEALGHDHVGSEHFLLAMTMHPDSHAGQALQARNITEARVREMLGQVLAARQ